ncbi:MAG TPA: trypsin-like peptidase domain-containing protein [Beutenbergiaceae bacterium]|nr:trypsin-like peptidase domain-containing protein [Beutenbergiaceae bacterium]
MVALLMLLSLLLGTLLGMVGSRWLFDTDQAAAPDPAPTPTPAPTLDGDGGEGGPDVAAIAEQVLPSTVSIEVRSGSQGFSGSGFVWHEEGYIVTNEHVIAEAEGGDVVVVLPDGGEEVAEVVGSTADYDLAVLQVERDDLTPLAIGDSDQIRVGDPVVAIGAPLGLDGTVTSGIVSALNRPIRVGEEGATFINAIQTDAAINLGNSGGPLVNTGGEVIGVNSAIASQPGQTGSIGLGFSIPSAQVDRTAQQIIDTGQATYPVIGAVLDNSHTGEGVRVLPSSTGGNEPITAGGPAEEAGLNAGDVIVAMDGVPVTSAEELIVLIRAHAPGEVVELTVREDGQDNSLEVTLGEEVSE